MKKHTSIFKLASALGVAGITAFSANAQDADPINQAISGTVSVGTAVAGNYTIDGGTVSGNLAPFNLSATVTSQGPTNDKSVTSGNKTTTTYTTKSVTSRITNANILEAAGIAPKGVTLGYFRGNVVAVTRSGRTTTLQDLSEFIPVEFEEPFVISSENLVEQQVDGGEPVTVSLSVTAQEIVAVGIGGEYSLFGLARTTGTFRKGLGTTYTWSAPVFGVAALETGAPAISAYAGDNATPEIEPNGNANVLINKNVTLTPTAENVSFVGAVWSATGLPKGLSINPTNGEITGRITTGTLNSFSDVTVTVKTAIDTATFEFTAILVAQLP